MAKSLEFFGALANIEHGPDKNTVLETLATEVQDFHLYKQVYEPGVIYASINWRGVLGRSAEIAAIGSLLWSMYVDKIEPNLNKQSPQPALIIQVKDADGNLEMISIDGSYQNKEVFIKDFSEKVERLRKSDSDDETVFETIETSERWIRVK